MLGCCIQPSPDAPIRYFDGQMRNVVVYNTYEAPEPSVLVMTITGLLVVLACARRKRRSTGSRFPHGIVVP